MKKVEVGPSSLFFGHGCAQHGKSERRESHCAWYHLYLIYKTQYLLDAVFLFEDSSHVGFRADALSGNKGDDSGEVDVDSEDSKSESY